MEEKKLFRGKRMDNGEWIEGYLTYRFRYDKQSRKEILWPVIDYPHDVTLGNTTGVVISPLTVALGTVGQFTGLTDKAGHRAFEHDVIKHHFGDEIGVIRFGNYTNPFGDDAHGGHTGFHIDWVAGSCPDCLRKDLGYWMRTVEIIGNIHDNPELLEVGHAQE